MISREKATKRTFISMQEKALRCILRNAGDRIYGVITQTGMLFESLHINES